MLPSDWPTLPASLLTEPGHVLDHLLCRHDAESDGRSPRGAHPTPTKLADSILADELKQDIPASGSSGSKHHKITLDALPPGFHVHLANLNLNEDDEEEERDEETEAEIASQRSAATLRRPRRRRWSLPGTDDSLARRFHL